ncbi:5266_t:CDS:2, partial [Gigaspora margarita]
LDIQEDKELKESQRRKVLLLEAESSYIDYGIEKLEKHTNMQKVMKEKTYKKKQNVLTLYGLPENTAEVLLLCQVRYLKAKAVYIPVNANFNPRRLAFVYFGLNEDLFRAYKSKVNYRNSLLYWKFCKWAESKNNPTQQKGAETSSRYKSEIKEKKTTRFIKKNENRMRRKTLELGNYTTMKSNNENEERSGHSKNESLNATQQEILNRLKKIGSSYSSSRAIATPDTGRVHEKTQGTHSWGVGIPKKEGLGGANLKSKEKEHLTDDIVNIMKDRFIRINKAKR